MSVVDTFLNLADYYAGESITLHPDRCLNARHRRVGCTICADVCPAEEAITVTSGTPALNNDACLHCGLCLHACPTNAYTRSDPLLRRLPQTVSTLPHGPVDLICPQHTMPNRGPSPVAVQTKRCLAALSPADLLELARQGREIWLDDSLCAACPLGTTHRALAQTVSETNSWASLLDSRGSIGLQTERRQPVESQERPVIQVDRPPVSRRGFFSSLKNLGREGLGVALAEEPVDPTALGRFVPVSERLPHFVPAQRARILTILDESTATNAPPDVRAAQQHPESPPSAGIPAAAPMVDVQVDPDLCSACGLCARFCPTGAITLLSDGDQFALAFHQALCLGEACHICQLACPEDAITLAPPILSPDLLNKKPRYLVAGDLTPCEKCGELIAAGPGHPTTCFVCRPQKPNLLASLK